MSNGPGRLEILNTIFVLNNIAEAIFVKYTPKNQSKYICRFQAKFPKLSTLCKCVNFAKCVNLDNNMFSWTLLITVSKIGSLKTPELDLQSLNIAYSNDYRFVNWVCILLEQYRKLTRKTSFI